MIQLRFQGPIKDGEQMYGKDMMMAGRLCSMGGAKDDSLVASQVKVEVDNNHRPLDEVLPQPAHINKTSTTTSLNPAQGPELMEALLHHGTVTQLFPTPNK